MERPGPAQAVFAIAELRQDHISLCDGAGIAISQSGADALFNEYVVSQTIQESFIIAAQGIVVQHVITFVIW